MVALIPSGLLLAFRSPPNRESSSRIEFRTCEKDKRSEERWMGLDGVQSPPPDKIVSELVLQKRDLPHLGRKCGC